MQNLIVRNLEPRLIISQGKSLVPVKNERNFANEHFPESEKKKFLEPFF